MDLTADVCRERNISIDEEASIVKWKRNVNAHKQQANSVSITIT
ncbi:hypothetical protein INT80_03350 [Gallibacterium anatis]|uniref:Uncharacterized protein n=1 Tax=Gallibacterium anatis TaxID=750 RepID=A0A930UTC8_9PAST|nr:hypothetical protein [Gallibacterium anatis]